VIAKQLTQLTHLKLKLIPPPQVPAAMMVGKAARLIAKRASDIIKKTPHKTQTNKPTMAENLKLFSISSSEKATTLTQNDGVPGCKFEGEPANYTVEQLPVKRWLKCRGIKQTGKREDLLAPVKDCLKSGNSHILDSCIDNGKWLEAKVLRERNAESLTSNTKTVNDFLVTVSLTGWKAFPSQNLPFLFDYGQLCIIMLLNLCRLCEGSKITTSKSRLFLSKLFVYTYPNPL